MEARTWPGFFALAGLVVLACSPGGSTDDNGDMGRATTASASLSAGNSWDSVLSPGSHGTTYYVRPDGGNPDQCSGLADAAYPGSGESQPCAWDHPFRALPPGEAPRIAGGDALVVAPGSYKMGYGAPGAEACEDEESSFDCHMPPIPSGSNPDRPTRVLGAGWDTGCNAPPELWGSGRPWFVVNLTDASNVAVVCFEITDHSGCVEDHTAGLACERNNAPYGDWAAYGLSAEDSSHVLLRHLNIHGLATGGVHAGRVADWLVEHVRVAANGFVGWDGDLWDDDGDSNSGLLTFRHWLVEWNGCGETYPEGAPVGCWAQDAGGYGDGVGTGETGGTWIIEDSAFLHNTSDGLDLLYHTDDGSITLRRVHAEGNAGNQVKTTGTADISDSVFIGNCTFFENQEFTHDVDSCRAGGNTLAVYYTGGDQVTLTNSTFYGHGDGLVLGGVREGYHCDGNETLLIRNSVFVGDTDYSDPSDIAFFFYQEDCGDLRADSDYNIIDNAKDVDCGVEGDLTRSGINDRCVPSLLVGPLSGLEFGMEPDAGSPAIDSGDEALCPPSDILGRVRPTDGDGDGTERCDIGAFEVR